MAGEWRWVQAQEFCASVRDGTHDSPKPVERGRFLVTSRHITGGRLDLDTAYLISQEDFDSINKRSKVDRWDVLISMIGTVGEPCLIRDAPDFAIKNVGLLKSKGEVEGKWLYYYLRTADAQQLIYERARGTTQQYIPLGALREFPIPVPADPEEMRGIAHILGTLDDKIELNRQMSETLDAMARALFKSWFVDFDPVRAKAEGRDPNLPQHLADLFPSSFGRSDLGEIPKGWTVSSLSDLTTIITKGTTPTQADMVGAEQFRRGANYVRVNAIEENGAVLFDKLTTIPEEVHSGVLKRSVLQAGDVLYTIAGTIGRSAIVEDSLLPANTNQAVAIIRLKPTIPPEFLAMTMQTPWFREELHSNIVHAVQANLSLGILSRARTKVPPLDILPILFRPIADIAKRIRLARAESRILAAERDSLLPKLFSGEVRVRSGVARNPEAEDSLLSF